MSFLDSLGDAMNVFHLVAVTGLLSLSAGMCLVNAVATPRAAQIGTVVAALGVSLLVLVAIHQLFAQVSS